jgi:hypothetical protein
MIIPNNFVKDPEQAAMNPDAEYYSVGDFNNVFTVPEYQQGPLDRYLAGKCHHTHLHSEHFLSPIISCYNVNIFSPGIDLMLV